MKKGNLHKNLTNYLKDPGTGRLGFVTQACNAYAQTLLKNEEQVRKQMKHSVFSADLWLQCAKDYLAEVEGE